MKTITLAWMGALVSAVAIVGLLAASQYMKKEKVDTRGCTQGVLDKSVIVLDTSDEVSAQTQSEMIRRVMNLVEDTVHEGEMVSIFKVSELSKKNLTPTFARCKPRRSGNALNENTRTLARAYKDKFLIPLQKALESPIDGSKQSPIAQSLVDISLSDYLRTNGAARLIIFSDFMEYTDKFSLYKCNSGIQAVSEFKYSRGASVARPTFRDVDVQLNIIPRPEISSAIGKCRTYFWNWFFGDNKGSHSRFVPSDLPG